MDKFSFAYRVRTIVPKGAITGAKWGLLLFIEYIVVIITILFVSTVFISGASEVLGLSLMALSMFAFGVLPWMISGLIEGGIIGFVLSFFRERSSGLLACLIGLSVGVILVLFVNYMYWHVLIYPNLKVSFFEYLFHIDTSSFFSLINKSGYFVPNLLAVLISPYLGWRINTIETIDLM